MIRNVYGFGEMPIDEVKREVEGLLGIRFESRHSYDRCGDYYVFRDDAGEVEAFLQENCEEDPGEWTEDKHRDMRTLLYFAADSDKSARTHAILTSSLKSIAILHRST